MGTPLIAPCLRAMGCKVGSWCYIETTLFSEFDLVQIGNCASLNLGSTIQTHLFEDRVFKADSLKLEDGCTVGNMSVVLYSTAIGTRASLQPMSVLMKGEVLAPATSWQGNPCEPVTQDEAPVAETLMLSPTRLAAPTSSDMPNPSNDHAPEGVYAAE